VTSDDRGLFDEAADADPGAVPSEADPARVKPDEVHPRSRAIAAADEAGLVAPPHAPVRHVDDGAADTRPVPVRLAHLHLRMGALALARAELESLAGRGMLDEGSLLDLAEVRWRTGDLAGAGEAANALLARGRGDTLALVIAAESVAAQGRPGEARRLAGRALEGPRESLDTMFAGIPRSLIWPAEADVVPQPGTPDDAGEPMAPRIPSGVAMPPVVVNAGRATGPAPAPTGAAEAFAGGRAALGAGDISTAAVRLGVALRLEPGYARDVLAAIGERAAEPALALVAGDALRLLGRESEALAAFDIARGHVHSPEEPHVRREAELDAADPGETPGG
jgi:hypothetical protein